MKINLMANHVECVRENDNLMESWWNCVLTWNKYVKDILWVKY
jgi:hypothetical protein